MKHHISDYFLFEITLFATTLFIVGGLTKKLPFRLKARHDLNNPIHRIIHIVIGLVCLFLSIGIAKWLFFN